MDAMTEPRPTRLTPEEAAIYELPELDTDALLPPGARVVVVAPHPDDEVLGAGGLLTAAGARGCRTKLIAVTDGTASHPGSTLWPEGRLALIRPAETAYALSILGVRAEIERLGLPDGDIANHADALAEKLSGEIGPDDVVVTTWRQDSHPDHQAVGKVCADAATRVGARLLETPIWSWSWLTDEDTSCAPARAQAVRLNLSPAVRMRKLRAVHAFDSQVRPDTSTGRPAVLHAGALVPLLRSEEIFFA